jgi:hypothetical protein
MRHLTPDQVVDLADGVETESVRSHWRACGTCQEAVADFRAAIEAVKDVSVPEPSPLFWDHFSARVREKVEEEPEPWTVTAWLRLHSGIMWASSAALVLLAFIVTSRLDRPFGSPSLPSVASGGFSADSSAGSDDDALSFVADLISDIDWDGAIEAGLTTHIGVDDDAVSQLSEGERRALHELLKGALARPGA